MRNFLSIVVLVAASTLAIRADEPAADPADELYTCRDASGSVVLQNDPCDVAPVKKKAPPTAPRTDAVKTPKAPKAAARPKPRPTAVPVSYTPSPSPPAPRTKSSFVAKPIRPVINPAVFTSDPQWGSPERTLKTFVGALKGGDRVTARACLAAGAADDLDRMRATVDAFNGYVLEGEVGPYWSIRALRPKTRPKWIFFTRASDGTWRIAAL